MKANFFVLFVLLIDTIACKGQKTDSLTIYFSTNQASITRENADRIDSFFKTKNDPPDSMTVDLFGYCDRIGRDDYNQTLSGERANAAKKYIDLYHRTLLQFGSIKGYGRTYALLQPAYNYIAWQNRRVTMVVRNTDASLPAGLPTPKPATSKKSGVLNILTDTSILVGSNVTLENLNFIGNSHYPLPRSMPELNTILSIFQKDPALKVEIQGFVCCIPENTDGQDSETGTFDLSVQRAKYVYDFLIKNKVAASRISYKGFGSSFKYEPPELNRRVEFKILDK